MKLTFFTILLALVVCGAEAQSNTPHSHISVLSVKKEVFYFKVDADFIGATVAVTDSTGTVFFTAELHNKHNLIDFFYLEKGKYTIHFEYHGEMEDYMVWVERKAGHEVSKFIALKPRA